MADTPYHEIGGVPYPRVSSIVGVWREPGIDSWRARVGEEAADKTAAAAARLGTALHKRVELFLQGKKVPATKAPKLLRAWQTWLQWWTCQSVEMQAAMKSWRTEQETLRWRDTPHGGYSGTPDLAIHAAPRAVYDWKCSSRIKESYFVQLHFYVPLVWPEYADFTVSHPPVTLTVVRIDPDLGMFQPESRPYDPEIMQDCFALLRPYRHWFFDPYIAKASEAAV